MEIALGVLLHIEEAFNSTYYESMCAALGRHGVDQTIIRWIRTILEGRQATATLGEISVNVAASKGCPQVGVLSPLPWCLVDELLTRLRGGGVYARQCVDDICFLVVGKFPNTVTGLTQWPLHTVDIWCSGHVLSINSDKTGHFAFTRKRKLPGFFQLRLFGRALQCSKSVKYLGVILDSRLTWSKHVNAKVRKNQNLLWACRRACGGRGA
jgi:hypothetical protein